MCKKCKKITKKYSQKIENGHFKKCPKLLMGLFLLQNFLHFYILLEHCSIPVTKRQKTPSTTTFFI